MNSFQQFLSETNVNSLVNTYFDLSSSGAVGCPVYDKEPQIRAECELILQSARKNGVGVEFWFKYFTGESGTSYRISVGDEYDLTDIKEIQWVAKRLGTENFLKVNGKTLQVKIVPWYDRSNIYTLTLEEFEEDQFTYGLRVTNIQKEPLTTSLDIDVQGDTLF